MNTSRPRTFSIISTLTSPSLKRPTARGPAARMQVPRDIVRQRRIRIALPANSASDRLESTVELYGLPAKT
jgi:hypothetical protein